MDMGFYDRGPSCVGDFRRDARSASKDVRSSKRLFDRHRLSDWSECIGMVGIFSRYGFVAVCLCKVKVSLGSRER